MYRWHFQHKTKTDELVCEAFYQPKFMCKFWVLLSYRPEWAGNFENLIKLRGVAVVTCSSTYIETQITKVVKRYLDITLW